VVLEHVSWAGTVRADDYDVTPPIIPVGVVVVIVVNDDPKPAAGVVVGVPIGITDIAVAVVADKPGIVVVLLDVIRNDVIIVLAGPGDARSEFSQAYVRVSPDPAVRNQPVVPVVAPDEFVILEWIGRGDREDIANAGVVIDGECAIIPVEYFEGPAAARKIVLPRFPGKQHPEPSVSIHPEHRDVSVGFSLEVHSGILTAPVRVLVTVSPEADALTFGGANPAGDPAELEGAWAGDGAGIG
jgi:hypothetical protein